jgi:hypothetical protein
MLVIRFAGKVCAAVAVAAAIGAGPAGAVTGVPLEPATAQPTAGPAAPIFVPDSGSAGVYNNFMCQLHAIVPSAPCMYT